MNRLLKTLALLALLVGLPAPSFAQWSLITHAIANGTVTATIGSITTTNATLITVYAEIQSASGQTITLTDNKSNTWLVGDTLTGGSNQRETFYYCQSPCIVGSGHTFTASTGNTNYITIAMVAVGGFSGWTLDQHNHTDNSQPAGGVRTGSITPTGVNRIIVAGATNFDHTISSPAVDSSMTLIDSQSFDGSTRQSVWSAYYFQPNGGGAIEAVFTTSNGGGDRMGAIMSFSAPNVSTTPPFTFVASNQELN